MEDETMENSSRDVVFLSTKRLCFLCKRAICAIGCRVKRRQTIYFAILIEFFRVNFQRFFETVAKAHRNLSKQWEFW